MKKLFKSLLSTSYRSLSNPPKVLITGSQGQIGTELIDELRGRYGGENVIASDITLPNDLSTLNDGPYYFINVLDKPSLERIVVNEEVDSIIHLGAFLSKAAEITPEPALALNTVGLHNVLDICEKYNLKTIIPSSIAAFGPTTPLDETPDICSQRPRSVYGVGKVYCELLGEYYFEKRGVDFRSLRYPGIISYKTLPGGGTTDFSVEMFYYALEGKDFECYIEEDVYLPMMYMEDCIKSTVDLFEAPSENLSQRTYNVTAMSFAPLDLQKAIQKHIPEFTVTYKPDNEIRNPLAKSWPNSLDDSIARKDWGWDPKYDLDTMVEDMLIHIKEKI